MRSQSTTQPPGPDIVDCGDGAVGADGAGGVALSPGDEVEWTNDSLIHQTAGAGQVIHVCGDHVVVLNRETARRHPQISPYVSKRRAELRLVRKAMAA